MKQQGSNVGPLAGSLTRLPSSLYLGCTGIEVETGLNGPKGLKDNSGVPLVAFTIHAGRNHVANMTLVQRTRAPPRCCACLLRCPDIHITAYPRIWQQIYEGLFY